MNDSVNADTLVQALRNSGGSGSSITYVNGQSDEHSITYRELQERALGVLYHLQLEEQLQPGAELIVCLDSNEQFVDVFWACMLGRIVAVPLATGPGDVYHQKLFTVFGKLEQPFLYTSSKTLERLEKFARSHDREEGFRRIRNRTVLAEACAELNRPGNPAEVRPNDVAFIQFSSGSTGEPKGVVLTHHNLMTNVRAILHGMAIRDSDCSLSWMPLTHDMGIIGFHLAPLTADRDLYLMPTELFVRRPMLWLQKISEKRVTITASPNFGLKHLLKRFKPKREQGLDLSCLRLIFNGAEPISAGLCREFAEVMAPFGYSEGAMFPVYGLAEASLAVTFSKPGQGVSSLHVSRKALHVGEKVEMLPLDAPGSIELVRVGFPVRGVEVRVADESAAPLPVGTVGHVLIRGGNVTGGYYRDEPLNRELFKEDGWLDTGDLGFLDEGELVISGRAKELIIVNGQNFHPHDLEVTCEAVDGVELGKAVACGVRAPSQTSDDLVIFVWFRGSLEEFLPKAMEIKQRITEQTGLEVRHVIPVRNIPKTTSGKVQRFLLAERYQQGDFVETAAALEQLMAASKKKMRAGSSIEETLLTICNSIIDDREVSVDDNLFEIGTSSLKLAQIHEQLEEHFPNTVEITDLFDYPTVAELAAYLEKRVA
jgi:acyl-CoA synthetase (AMP-forming)/AMP-acid ligase II/acyl carrier protein